MEVSSSLTLSANSALSLMTSGEGDTALWIRGTGAVSRSNTASLHAWGDFVNEGTYTQTSSGDLKVFGAITNSGTFTVSGTSTVTVENLCWNKAGGIIQRTTSNSTGTFTLKGGFRNDGQYTATAANSPLVVGSSATYTGDFTNNGTFSNGAGSLTFYANFTNNQSGADFGTGTATFAG